MTTRPIISLIAAMDVNRVIGKDGRIPWRLPDDMKWFRQQTMGKPVIMGRKTYESIPERFRPLPGRHNIVVTRNEAYRIEGETVVHAVEEAVAAAGDVAEIMVIGGAELYAQFFPGADRLYLTLVEAMFPGDAYFPEMDSAEWRKVWQETHEIDARHPYPFVWLIFERG
ncbi:MAG: type 3 dihydrofolate reductase [Chloroflexi bacterium]|nr:type 3 dihydrofolate reductase [Chloroflexota bacterium]